jgi:MarR family transcriptional repressor of emrRAB
VTRANVRTSPRLANIFGALSLIATDAMVARAAQTVEHGGATPAALTVIGHDPGGLTIDVLADILGLSHPGAVRAVDRLVAAGLVERHTGAPDRRQVELRLTALGRRTRAQVLHQRQAALDDLLRPLTASEQQQLATIASKLLAARTRDDGAEPLTVCRLCDESICHECPVESGARS